MVQTKRRTSIALLAVLLCLVFVFLFTRKEEDKKGTEGNKKKQSETMPERALPQR